MKFMSNMMLCSSLPWEILEITYSLELIGKMGVICSSITSFAIHFFPAII